MLPPLHAVPASTKKIHGRCRSCLLREGAGRTTLPPASGAVLRPGGFGCGERFRWRGFQKIDSSVDFAVDGRRVPTDTPSPLRRKRKRGLRSESGAADERAESAKKALDPGGRDQDTLPPVARQGQTKRRAAATADPPLRCSLKTG